MTQDTIKSRLQAARALIDQPEKWTQGAFRRDAQGNELMISHLPVARRCAYGAIIAVSYADEDIEIELSDALERVINDCEITYWNDRPDRTHAEVMQAFDRAIEDVPKS